MAASGPPQSQQAQLLASKPAPSCPAEDLRERRGAAAHPGAAPTGRPRRAALLTHVSSPAPAPRRQAAPPPQPGRAAGEEAAAPPGARSSPGRPAGVGLLSDGSAPLATPQPRSPRRRRQHPRAHQRPDPARLRFLFNPGAAGREGGGAGARHGLPGFVVAACFASLPLLFPMAGAGARATTPWRSPPPASPRGGVSGLFPSITPCLPPFRLQLCCVEFLLKGGKPARRFRGRRRVVAIGADRGGGGREKRLSQKRARGPGPYRRAEAAGRPRRRGRCAGGWALPRRRCAFSACQFSVHLTVCLSVPDINSLGVRILWKTVPRASLKSR